jgi:hypothetical protein
LGEGEFLVLAQVVDQDGQGVEFLLLVHEIYFDKFHEKLQDLFHIGNAHAAGAAFIRLGAGATAMRDPLGYGVTGE